MQRFSKRHSRRFGATTIFLSIILSALILIECTYLILVANLDRGITLMRAASLQVDTYLAQYDRQLFKTYGVYAFDSMMVDDVVFNNVMTANGIEDGHTLVVSGMETFDTNDLKAAISTYYAYRGTGIIINTFSDAIGGLLDGLNATGIVDSMRSFTSSDASGMLRSIIDGSHDVAGTLAEYSEESEETIEQSDINSFDGLMDSFDNIIGGNLNPDDGFDPSDIGFIYDAVSFMNGLYDGTSDVIEDYLFHPFLAHYAAYNFDCALDNDIDFAIDGTSFNEFHEGNQLDSEYIMTGIQGEGAGNRMNIYSYIVLFINRIINTYNDPEARAIIDIIATILSIVISVISFGVVSLPESVYRAVIIVIYSAVLAKSDLDSLLEGEKVTVGAVGNFDGIQMGYRDFMFVFMFFHWNETLLERIRDVLMLDFPNHVVKVTVTASSNTRSDYVINKEYELYEET